MALIVALLLEWLFQGYCYLCGVLLLIRPLAGILFLGWGTKALVGLLLLGWASARSIKTFGWDKISLIRNDADTWVVVVSVLSGINDSVLLLAFHII